MSVPVGDLSNSHQSFCFRAFKMVRELEAHRYRLTTERPRPPGEGWAKALQRVLNDVSPPPSPPPVDAGAPDAEPGFAGGLVPPSPDGGT